MSAQSKQSMQYEDRYKLGTHPLPTTAYISPEEFELERQEVFKKCWLPLARVEDIPEVGDYYVLDIAMLQTSVILVRQDGGSIGAFHNACSHRCNKLLAPGKGHGSRIRCPFHGWSFKLSGDLHRATNESLFPNLDKSSLGLQPLSVEIWEGFIFVNRMQQPKETLAEWLGELYDVYDGYFANKSLAWTWGVENLKTNWKILLDASSESYHAPTLHASTLRNAASGKNNPNSLFNRIELYRYHRTGSIYANPDFKLLPTEALVTSRASTRLYPASSSSEGLPPGINPQRDPNWAFDVLLFFPNVFLLLASGWYSMTTIWPRSVNMTDVIRRVYMFEPKSIGDVIAQENMMVTNREVFRQDMSTVEGSQEMMESGAFTHMTLCDEEVMIRHSLDTISRFRQEHR